MITGCDAYFLNISALTSANLPVVEYSALRNGFLQIAVRTPLVTDRKSTNIFLRNETLFPNCAYQNWVKTIENCEERYVLLLPWTAAGSCGWTLDDTTTPMEISFSNDIYIQHSDEVSIFRGNPVYRETSYVLSIIVKFRTSVEVGTNQLTVTAPVTLLAAITADAYYPSIRQGQINFTTSLQWPFALVSQRIVGGPTGLSSSLSVVREDCPSTPGSHCTQDFSVLITPDAACSLSGLYEFGFGIVCRGNQSECPLDPLAAEGSIVAQILSDNFCTFLTVDIGLRATLATYDSGTLLDEKSSFLQDDLIFGGLSVTSDSGVAITGASIRSIVISDNRTEVFLRSNAYTLDIGQAVGLVVNNFDPSAPWFQFQLSSVVFNVEPNDSRRFEIIVMLDVTYIDESGRRRSQPVRVSLGKSKSKRQEISVALPSVNRAEDAKAISIFTLANSAYPTPTSEESSTATHTLYSPLLALLAVLA